MQKIPTIFIRDFDGDPSKVLPEPNPETAWVFAGEGRATVKLDGTACLLRGGQLFKRYDAKKGRNPPPGFEPCDPEPDRNTGHWPGWLPIGDGPEDRYHREALEDLESATPPPENGTYELVGPKVQSNPYRLATHLLWRHGAGEGLQSPPLSFEGLRAFLASGPLAGDPIEGIVWHHPDGRMAKIKRRDFGLPWPT